MGENASDGVFSIDPFDARNIDAIADAVAEVLPDTEEPAMKGQTS